MLDDDNAAGQVMVCDSLKAVRIKPNQSPLQRYAVKPQYFVPYDPNRTDPMEQYTIRFFDPFDVMNCGTFLRARGATNRYARLHGKGKPYVLHLAYIGGPDKEQTVTNEKMWFYTGGRCIPDPPGAAFNDFKPENKTNN
jgi:hypothetical protein